jgi:hypothetical protein
MRCMSGNRYRGTTWRAGVQGILPPASGRGVDDAGADYADRVEFFGVSEGRMRAHRGGLELGHLDLRLFGLAHAHVQAAELERTLPPAGA